jgi:hypothetical protein
MLKGEMGVTTVAFVGEVVRCFCTSHWQCILELSCQEHRPIHGGWEDREPCTRLFSSANCSTLFCRHWM